MRVFQKFEAYNQRTMTRGKLEKRKTPSHQEKIFQSVLGQLQSSLILFAETGTCAITSIVESLHLVDES